jgi:hypothetical protein
MLVARSPKGPSGIPANTVSSGLTFLQAKCTALILEIVATVSCMLAREACFVSDRGPLGGRNSAPASDCDCRQSAISVR